MPWRLEVDGDTWTTQDYTLDEMVAVEKRTGFQWGGLRPHSEAEHARALIIHWYARTGPVDDAEKRAGVLTDRQVRVTEMPDDDRPAQHNDGIPVVDPKADGDGPATT